MNKQKVILVRGKHNISLADATQGMREESAIPFRAIKAIQCAFTLICQRHAVLGCGDCAIAYDGGRYVLVTNFKKS